MVKKRIHHKTKILYVLVIVLY